MVGVPISEPQFDKPCVSGIFAKSSVELLPICCIINYIGIIEIISTVQLKYQAFTTNTKYIQYNSNFNCV
jgi:hypothetical protein